MKLMPAESLVANIPSLWSGFKDHNAKRKRSSVLGRVVGPITNGVIDKVVYPILSQVFVSTCDSVVSATSFFSPAMSKRLETLFFDPISTERLLKLGVSVQRTFRGWATRTPCQIPILCYPDQCGVSIARHIHALAKHINALLRIPGKLRYYLYWNTVYTPESLPNTFLGRVWVKVQQGTGLVVEGLLYLVSLVIKAIDLPLHYIPYVKRGMETLSTKLYELRQTLHARIIHGADRVIRREEANIRRRVIKSVTRTMVKEGLSTAIQLSVSWQFTKLFFRGTKEISSYFTGNEALGDMSASVFEWGFKLFGLAYGAWCFKPTFQSIHDEYREEYDPDTSTLLDFATLVNRKNLYRVIGFIQDKFSNR